MKDLFDIFLKFFILGRVRFIILFKNLYILLFFNVIMQFIGMFFLSLKFVIDFLVCVIIGFCLVIVIKLFIAVFKVFGLFLFFLSLIFIIIFVSFGICIIFLYLNFCIIVGIIFWKYFFLSFGVINNLFFFILLIS